MSPGERTWDDAESWERRWRVIEAKLEAHADMLVRQGAIVAKQANGRKVWVIRFKAQVEGKSVQRMIYLGGDDQPELIRRAQAKLNEYRELKRLPAELASFVRMARRLSAIARRAVG